MNETLSQLNEFAHAFDGFIVGAVAMGHWVAGLFFLRFWRKTGDRFFALFAIAFWILGINRFAMVLAQWYGHELTEHHFVYWVRFVAYLVILVAILDKNRSK
jgi:hypothetical protein